MWEIALERVSGLPLLRLVGALVLGPETESFAAAVKELLAQGEHQILCHLGAVERIDSSGIAALLTALELVAASGGRLMLVAVSPRVRSIFESTRLISLFEVADDEGGAVRALAERPKRVFPTGFEREPGL